MWGWRLVCHEKCGSVDPKEKCCKDEVFFCRHFTSLMEMYAQPRQRLLICCDVCNVVICLQPVKFMKFIYTLAEARRGRLSMALKIDDSRFQPFFFL